MNNPAFAYRQSATNGASPVGLILMLYEGAVTFLNRAIQAIEASHPEQRATHLNRALNVLGYLQSLLNFEQGGEVATQLDRFYTHARAQVLEASVLNSSEILISLRNQILSVRETWQQVESAPAGGSGKSATKYPAPPGEPPAATYPGTARKQPEASTPGTMHWSA